MSNRILLSAEVPANLTNTRIDQAAQQLFSDYSRARLQEWIKSGQLTCNNQQLPPKAKVRVGDLLALDVQLEAEISDQPEDLNLEVVFEDDQLLVVNKPAGLVVHPAAGHASGTLLNALLFHCPSLEQLPRAGIVHRLDKDTSGILVVAKTLTAQASLVEQLQARSMQREYLALVEGRPPIEGKIDAPIGRHPKDRQRQAVVNNGKPAMTYFQQEENFAQHCLLLCQLETGRTHQIRVHLKHLGFPLVGDAMYGSNKNTLIKRTYPQTAAFNRQALHAFRLGLEHPITKQQLSWQQPMPADMAELIASLRWG